MNVCKVASRIRLQAVADGCRWLQIKLSICNHANKLANKGLSRIFRLRLQSCR